MKSIFRLFLLLIVVVIGAPVGAGALAMQPGFEEPAYFQEFDYTSFQYDSIVDSKIQSVLVSNLLGEKTIRVDEALISKIIHKEMGGFEGDDFRFVIEPINTTITLNNTWVSFDDGYFNLNGLFNIANQETSFQVKLLFEDFDGYTKISFGSVKIGKLPLPKVLFTQGLSFVESKGLTDLESQYEFGALNTDELYVTLDDEHLNEALRQQLNSDVVEFVSLVLDDQNIHLNYEFVGKEGEAVNTMVAELNQVIKSRESFMSNLSTNLTQKSSLEASKITEVTERVDAVLETLDQKMQVMETETVEITEEEKQVFKDLVDTIDTIEDPQEKDQVTTVFINTVIDQMEPSSKEVIADYLNVSVDELEDANYKMDHTYINDLFDQFFGNE
jgi:hypothetical protein